MTRDAPVAQNFKDWPGLSSGFFVWAAETCSARDCFELATIDGRCKKCHVRACQPSPDVAYALLCVAAGALWFSSAAGDRLSERRGAVRSMCPLDLSDYFSARLHPKVVDLTRRALRDYRLRSSWYLFGGKVRSLLPVRHGKGSVNVEVIERLWHEYG